MYLDNVKDYVLKGSAIYGEEKTPIRISGFLPSLTILGGCIVGGRLRGIWGNLLPAMVLISLACVFIVFKASKYGLYLHEALCLDVVISVAWVLNMSILELMCFVSATDFTPWFCLIYLVNIIVPGIFGFAIYRSLKNDNKDKKIVGGSTISLTVGSGAVFTSLAKGVLRGESQERALMGLIVCSCLLSSLLSSFGFISLQKLYFIKKYKISM